MSRSVLCAAVLVAALVSTACSSPGPVAPAPATGGPPAATAPAAPGPPDQFTTVVASTLNSEQAPVLGTDGRLHVVYELLLTNGKGLPAR